MPALPLTLAAIRQPAFLYDADGRIAEANEPAAALAGRPLEGCSTADVVGILDLRAPDGTPLTAADLPEARALAGEEAVNVPLMVTAGDGRTVHLLASASPLREGDAVAGALVIWQDVSALVTARAGAESSAAELEEEQEELRQQGDDLHRSITELDRQRRLLDTILASLPHRVSLWDRDHRLTWANERFALERGLALEEMLGRPWAEIGYDPSVIGPLTEETVQATSAGGAFAGELEVAGPEGTPWLSFKAVPIFGDSILVISEEITGRKEAEDRLRRSAETVRALINTPTDMALLLDADGTILEMNDSYAAALGRPAGEFVGECVWDVMPLEVVESRRAQFDRAIETKRTVRFEEDRNGRWFDIIVNPIPSDGERVGRIAVIAREVTDRKQAEEALRRSLERLSVAQAAAKAGFWDWDVKTDELTWARELFDLLDLAPAEGMTFDTWVDLIHPEDREAAMAAVDRSVSEHTPIESEVRVILPDGQVRWISTLGDTSFDEDGRPRRVSGICVDITARRRAEEALRESEEQLRLATACARIGMWEWHRPGDGEAGSGEYVRLDDSALPDIMHLDAWRDLVHPDDIERVEAERDVALSRGDPFELEFRYAPEPGSVGWMRVLGGGIFDEQGRLLRVLGVNMDITDEKRAEEALRESEEKYRRLVNDDITGHVITSPDGRILDCNPAFARIFGFSSVEEARSSSMVETYNRPEDREARIARLRVERRFENEGGFRRRRDGTRIHIVENVIGDFDDAGNLVQIRGYISDDTERHRAREELQESERRHAFLLELGDRLRELADVPEIMAVASELVGRHLGANGVVYCEIGAGGECATVLADWNDGTVPRLAGQFRMDDFGIGDLYRRGLVRRTGDVTAENDGDEVTEHCALRIRASLGVPIFRSGRLAAVLAVHSARPREWTDAEVELVREAGDRIFASVERARAEEALRLSEERLRLAQEGARIGIWDRDAVTDRVTITPGFLDPYGLDETSISCYADLVPLIHPEDLEQVEAERRAAFAVNAPLNLEFRVITPPGEARWVQFKGHGFPGEEGPPSRVIGVLIDVTDQKRAEAALLEREQTMQSIFRAAPTGIGMVTHRTITMANDQLCRMTGYAREELIGQDARVLYPSDEAYDYVGREKYAQILERGTGAVETQWRTKDGTVLDILVSSSPVDLSRPHENVIFNALDITPLRESERALASYMDELQRSNEELQRFAYVASHDLQEPLRSIISFSQLLERRYKGKLDQDADEFIGFIVEGGNRMQQLILDLLQLSRVETKAKPLVPTDAGEVAADAIRLMETPIREAGATVTMEDLPTVMADAAQLAQVFTNLVGNALKYRRPDVPPVIRISAERRGKFWRFAVEDNGIGIEAEYFDRIFVIFQRLHTREEYEGTGIGLAVVRRIVERHGGRIGVESTPGEGSTFFFTLPAA